MQGRNAARALAGFAALTLAGLAPATVRAQAAADPWQWDASVYAWLPALGGTTSFPSGGGPSVDVSADQIIDSLKFAFMGSLGARKGRWGIWTDLVYADFGASRQSSRDFTIGRQALPAGVQGDLDLDIEVALWTVAGTYQWTATPGYTLDFLAGVRLLDARQALAWSLNGDISGLALPGRTGSGEATADNWDAIIGVKGRAYLGAARRWFIPYHVDIGTGESDFVWQVNAGVGYRFGSGSIVASWRYLDYDMKPGEQIQSLNLSGPVIGVAFQW